MQQLLSSPSGGTSLRLRPLRVESISYRECLEYLRHGEKPTDAQRPNCATPVIGARSAGAATYHLPGSYLVTGYRGVGKTSFLNYALARAHHALANADPAQTLVPVQLAWPEI